MELPAGLRMADSGSIAWRRASALRDLVHQRLRGSEHHGSRRAPRIDDGGSDEDPLRFGDTRAGN